MTTATPIPPPTFDDGSLPVEPVEPPAKNGFRALWLILGGLALLVAVGTAVFIATGSSDGNPAVVNDHTAQVGEPALISVPGYTYENAPADIAMDLDSMMTQTNDQLASMYPSATTDIYTSWSIHNVMSGAEKRVAGLSLMAIDQQFVSGQPGVSEDMIVSGVAGGMASEGATVSTETIEGETVAVAEGDLSAFAWYHDGTVSMAFGDNENDLRAFVGDYLAVANG